MPRKRLTQLFPFLLPLRQWQRKRFFYLKMRFDGCRYADTCRDTPLAHEVFRTEEAMLNYESGYDMRYQYNKVHNLRLAAATVNGLIIRPGESFSFWRRLRHADRETPYKDGLVLSNGKITGAYGGGLCQLSSMLYWMFLHTPLTVTERHGHHSEELPPAGERPFGTDATVNEGWLDLRIKNETDSIYQLFVTFDEEKMYGRILCDRAPRFAYDVFNAYVTYYRETDGISRCASVDRRCIERQSGKIGLAHLYNAESRIGYALPDDVQITEKRNER